MQVGEHHWSLWASDNRENIAGNLGYPKQTTFYTPSRRSDGFGVAPITEEDRFVADILGQAVQRATESDRMALVEFFGARPGAPAERTERLKRLEKLLQRNRTAVFVYVRTARARVEGYVEGRLSSLDSAHWNG